MVGTELNTFYSRFACLHFSRFSAILITDMKTKFLVAAVLLFLPFLTAPVYADCGGVHTVVISCKNSGNKSAIIDLLVTIVNFLAVGVGIAVVAGIVYGGFLYASADTNADQAKRGIGHVRNAVIGLVIFIFMYAIINYLIPGGLL